MKCYAKNLGNCQGLITREHYISKSVLEIAGKKIQVSGFPWQENNKPIDIGINSLASNILCEFHNSQLSPLDENGRKLLFALKTSFDQAISNEIFSAEIFAIDVPNLNYGY